MEMSLKEETLRDNRMFESNAFQSLGAMIEKVLSPIRKKRKRGKCRWEEKDE